MCGIAGILDTRDGRVSRAELDGMIAPLDHRGPDELGVYSDGPIGLAHSRLSIIDLEGGRQPMSGADGSVVITFNGEIFNYIELREELLRLGHEFRTQSDTEVLLHAYLEMGEECVHRLNGQWAFAIWDKRKRRLFCSRDRLGIRPLYYTVADGRFVFASEIKSLFTVPSVSREVDLRGLDQLLTFWSIAAPRTFYRDVSQVPPGHSLTVTEGDVRLHRYWGLDYPGPDGDVNEGELAEELLALLVDSARLRLRSDVPVGAYLSGGLDSSIITGILDRHTDISLKTFSVTFEDAEFDESSHQNDVVDYLGVDHFRTLCRTSDIGRVFPDVVHHMEQPTVRTAPAPLFMLSRLVREQDYKVVLTGEGADEVFGGYDIFKEARVRRMLAEDPGARGPREMLGGLYPWMPGLQAQPDSYIAEFFKAGPDDLSDPFFSHLPRWDLTSRLKMFYSSDVAAELEGYDCREEIANALPSGYLDWDPFSRAQYLETRYLMPGYILSSQGDRMAMAHSVEGRFPFLDHRVVEFASRLPPDLKIKGMDEKYLLKKAAGDLVPPFLHTRPKQPYRAPDSACFFAGGRARFPWVEEAVSEEAVTGADLFDPKAVRLLARKAANGRVRGIKDGMALCAILSAQLCVSRYSVS